LKKPAENANINSAMDNIKLTIDAGNTEIDIGCFYADDLVRVSGFPTADFNCKNLNSWVKDAIKNDTVTAIGLSCVVPRFQKEIETCLAGFGPIFNISPATLPELVINAENRNELGADFICAYYGVLAKYKTPAIVFDLGSATKTMFVSAENEILGVAIKPGLLQSLKAMITNIPHLPDIELGEPETIIGHNTIEAIRSGVFYGELSNIKHYGLLLDEHYGVDSIKIVTGGYSNYFTNHLEGYVHNPDLLLYGINKIIDLKL